jgi:hypothetical protein
MVLLSRGRAGTNEIMRRAGESKTRVWRWEGARVLWRSRGPLLRDPMRQTLALLLSRPGHNDSDLLGDTLIQHFRCDSLWARLLSELDIRDFTTCAPDRGIGMIGEFNFEAARSAQH